MQTTTTQDRRVAVVTGGAMGIGGEAAERLAVAGFNVVVADLDAAAADATAARLREQGRMAASLALDVAQPDSVSRAFAHIESEYGRCDVLVNSAGIAKVFPFLEFPLDNFQATMAVNVTGTFLCSQAAARLMVRHRWGRIVNIASVAGLRAVGTGRTAYGTSKGAVVALTRQMAVELAEHNVTANAVCPGPVDTPMTRVLHSERFREEYSKAIPMNRYGTTGEIAGAVMYLVSEEAGYVTGIAMPVDGGFLASGARGV
jgi:NAD(P)-dependent dehydrogenase (short-subunit alcohol dehydrogenase family)